MAHNTKRLKILVPKDRIVGHLITVFMQIIIIIDIYFLHSHCNYIKTWIISATVFIQYICGSSDRTLCTVARMYAAGLSNWVCPAVCFSVCLFVYNNIHFKAH